MKENLYKFLKNTDFWFFVFLLVGLFIRLYKIDLQSLWNDELATYTWLSGKYQSFSQVIASCKADVHPPFYYLFANFWLKYVLYSEMSLRYLSVIFGFLGIIAIYVYGKKVFNPFTGLCAALLTSLNPFHVLHSQNSRPYSLLFLLAILSCYTFSIFIERLCIKNLIIYVFVTIFLIYTHYFGLVLLVSQGIYVVFLLAFEENKRKLFKYYFMAGLSIVLLYLPWINNILLNLNKNNLIEKPKWNFFDVYIKEYFIGNMVYYSIYFVFLVGIIFLVIKILKRDLEYLKNKKVLNKIIFLIFMIFFTYFIPYLKSVLSYPILKPRNTIITLPLILLLSSYLISFIKIKYLKTIILLFIFSSNCYNLFYISKQFTKKQREQWKEVIEIVSTHSSDSDIIVSGKNMIYFQEYMNLLSIKKKVLFLSKEKFIMKFFDKNIKGLWVLKAHYKNEKLVFDELINKYFIKQKEFIFRKAKCIYYILPENNRDVLIFKDKKKYLLHLLKKMNKTGKNWVVKEGNWLGIWRPIENSLKMNATWKNKKTGKEIRDILEISEIGENGEISIYRESLKLFYKGKINKIRSEIKGSTDWQTEWKAIIN